MDIDVFTRQELGTVFRVLRTALNPGELEPRELTFLQTYARITEYALPVHSLQRIDARDVAISTPHRCKRLIQLTALAVLLSRPIRSESFAFLSELSAQLATHDSVIDTIEAAIKDQRGKVRVLSMRRAFRVMFKESWLAEGPMGVVRFFGAMIFKARVNKDKLWNYKKLGLLPEGTLGREYWKHMVQVGFAFPGEPAGIPDSVAYHDIGHVLAQNPATPLGEIQQGCFQGGNRREDGFLFIQFVILHFHHGFAITPGAPPEVGNFDPELALWAIHRGARCNVDITHQWNFWPLMSLPMAEAAAKIGLLPKLHELRANALTLVAGGKAN